MDLYVDGRKRTAGSGSTETLDEVLEPIRRENSDSERVIVDLVCDGIDLMGDDLQASLAKRASGYERVEVRTATPGALVLDALHVAQAAYETANEERTQVVELMGQGKTSEAIGQLARCLESWQQINEMIAKSISFLGMKDQTLGNVADQVAVKLEPVKRQLSQIKEALTSQDFVALADILQYEFEEAGRSWLEVIQSILDYAETNGKAPSAG